MIPQKIVFSDHNAKNLCNPREHFVCKYLLEVRNLVTNSVSDLLLAPRRLTAKERVTSWRYEEHL